MNFYRISLIALLALATARAQGAQAHNYYKNAHTMVMSTSSQTAFGIAGLSLFGAFSMYTKHIVIQKKLQALDHLYTENKKKRQMFWDPYYPPKEIKSTIARYQRNDASYKKDKDLLQNKLEVAQKNQSFMRLCTFTGLSFGALGMWLGYKNRTNSIKSNSQ